MKTILVTGASTGIGRVIATYFCDKGFKVFAGARNLPDLEAIQSENLIPIELDVTQRPILEKAASQLKEHHGLDSLDVLVNNAGIAVGGPIEALSVDDFKRQFEVNVYGVVSVVQTFLPFLRKAKGHIVNMSSISGRCSYPNLGAYTSSKYALESISDALRYELASFGITVSIIEPGAVATPIWKKAEAGVPKILDSYSKEIHELYPNLADELADIIAGAKKNGVAPEKVAHAVYRSAIAKKPAARYLVGTEARMGVFLKWLLPTSLFDRLVT